MTKFEKPGARTWDYPDVCLIPQGRYRLDSIVVVQMGREAVQAALADAALPFDAIEAAAVGYCYGDSTCGQRALYTVGMSGIPIFNVNNKCVVMSLFDIFPHFP